MDKKNKTKKSKQKKKQTKQTKQENQIFIVNHSSHQSLPRKCVSDIVVQRILVQQPHMRPYELEPHILTLRK